MYIFIQHVCTSNKLDQYFVIIDDSIRINNTYMLCYAVPRKS